MSLYNLYIKKLHPGNDNMWQKPKGTQLHYTDEVWFEPKIVGHDKLERFMVFLSKDLELSEKYTNHCIRSTCITLLNSSGFEGRHITVISGHKSEATIKTYSVKCPPPSKKEEMFDVISSKIAPPPAPKRMKSETVSTPPEEQQLMGIQIVDLENIDPMENDDEVIQRFLNQYPNILDPKAAESLLNAPPKEQDTVQEQRPKSPEMVVNIPMQQPTIPLQSAATVNNSALNIPVIPKMYFPNSNVTINYNFGK